MGILCSVDTIFSLILDTQLTLSESTTKEIARVGCESYQSYIQQVIIIFTELYENTLGGDYFQWKPNGAKPFL